MPATHVEISDLEHEERGQIVRAIEEYDIARREQNVGEVALADEPEAVAERVRYGDDSVELVREPDDGVDEVLYVLRALDHQLERIDEGKPDREEDPQRSKTKQTAMSGRAALLQHVRRQADEQGVTYDDREIHSPTE